MVDGLQVEGTFRSHQVPLSDPATHPEHLKLLEDWLRSYRPEELFDEQGRLKPELAELAPKGERRMGANPHANGGMLLRDLRMPDYRNGYYGRTLGSLYGPLDLRIPRCRRTALEPWIIFEPYQRRMGDVDRILRRAYLLGASTRGDAELAEQIFGGSLSPQSISNLMKSLDDDLAAYRKQPVADDYSVVHIDGMYVHMLGQERTCVMIVLGAKEDGSTDVLGFCVGAGESCGDLLKDLQDRGLKTVKLFVSDDSLAIRSAIAEHYPEIPWQYCTVHRLADLRRKIGDDRRPPLALLLANPLLKLLGTNVNRKLGPILEGTGLRIVRQELAGLRGFFKIVLLRKD